MTMCERVYHVRGLGKAHVPHASGFFKDYLWAQTIPLFEGTISRIAIPKQCNQERGMLGKAPFQ